MDSRKTKDYVCKLLNLFKLLKSVSTLKILQCLCQAYLQIYLISSLELSDPRLHFLRLTIPLDKCPHLNNWNVVPKCLNNGICIETPHTKWFHSRSFLMNIWNYFDKDRSFFSYSFLQLSANHRANNYMQNSTG